MLDNFPLQLRVKPEVAYDPLRLRIHISTLLNTDVNSLPPLRIVRRSIDARQRQVMVQITVDVEREAEVSPTAQLPDVHGATEVLVVGAGPAGLFAALELIRCGYRPILFERGKDVDARRLDLPKISRQGIVDPDSNYCFGEGGAGAFSDGKLYTRSTKRGPVTQVLQTLVDHGASPEILVDAHPHIGSDRLPGIIKSIRETIIRQGGEVHFNTRVTDLIVDPQTGAVTGLEAVSDGTTKAYHGDVILATGHSARDVYKFLKKNNIPISPKGIAIGVRVEHPQAEIDKIFYHSPSGRGKYLPAAEYSLLTRVDGRAVYSFCMCPGGYIIPAASAPGELVVNGMSPASRGTRWANSGMVVEILPEDVEGDDPLRILQLQQQIERRFWEEKNDGASEPTQQAPAQRLTDFVNGRQSTSLADSSYTAGIYPARVDRLLPPMISDRLRKGFAEFGRKYRGYLTPQATVIGCETRTSAPVQITRDPQTRLSVPGLYPAGEGAGYAGGIVSAAIDGIRAAQAVTENHKQQ